MRRTLMIAVTTAALVAGCGGGSSKTASPSTEPTAEATTDSPTPEATPTSDALPDPCSLLTAEQAEALAGTKLNPPVAAGSGDPTLCQRTGPTTGPTAQVEVIVGDGAKKTLDIDKDTLGHTFTSLPGIGDEAYLETGYVFVHKGSLWAEINLVLLDASDAVQAKRLTAAAAAMAANMP